MNQPCEDKPSRRNVMGMYEPLVELAISEVRAAVPMRLGQEAGLAVLAEREEPFRSLQILHRPGRGEGHPGGSARRDPSPPGDVGPFPVGRHVVGRPVRPSGYRPGRGSEAFLRLGYPDARRRIIFAGLPAVGRHRPCSSRTRLLAVRHGGRNGGGRPLSRRRFGEPVSNFPRTAVTRLALRPASRKLRRSNARHEAPN